MVSESEQGDSLDRYLLVCEQMGIEPQWDNMPITLDIFPYEVQLAVSLTSLLNDRWDGAAGLYLGKDWSLWNYLMDEYEVDDRKEILLFAKIYENCIIRARSKKIEAHRQKTTKKKDNHGGSSGKVINHR